MHESKTTRQKRKELFAHVNCQQSVLPLNIQNLWPSWHFYCLFNSCNIITKSHWNQEKRAVVFTLYFRTIWKMSPLLPEHSFCLPWSPCNTWPEQRLSRRAFSHSKKTYRFWNFFSFHILTQEKRHDNFHKLKISPELDKILPNFILCFPFSPEMTLFLQMKRNFKTKNKAKSTPRV